MTNTKPDTRPPSTAEATSRQYAWRSDKRVTRYKLIRNKFPTRQHEKDEADVSKDGRENASHNPQLAQGKAETGSTFDEPGMQIQNLLKPSSRNESNEPNGSIEAESGTSLIPKDARLLQQ